MKIKARFFALFREVTGKGVDEFEVKAPFTAGDFRKEVVRRYPPLKEYFVHVTMAVNTEYAGPEALLKDGDEVAFFPPLSGGSMIQVTSRPVDPEQITTAVRKGSHGAAVTFLGTVRDNAMGKRVLRMEYEAYKEMAEKKMVEIAAEIKERWGLDDVSMVHRVGPMAIGDISLVIAIGSPHRKEAFEACAYAVDRIKEIVPIWKKETFEDWECWVDSEHPIIRPPNGTRGRP